MEDIALWDHVFRDLAASSSAQWNAHASPLMREFRQYPSLRKHQFDHQIVVNNNIKMLCDAAQYASALPDFPYHSDDEQIERRGVWFESAKMHKTNITGDDEGWYREGYDNAGDAHAFAKNMSNATGRDFQVWYNWADLPYVIPILQSDPRRR